MIKKNKWKLVLSSLVILLPIVIGMWLWSSFPEQMQSYWFSGSKTVGWREKFLSVFVFPVSIFVIYWFIIFTIARDLKNKEQSSKAVNMALWIIPMITFVVSCNIYAIPFADGFHVGMIMRAIVGIVFIVIGNYLPKCRQNQTIGVKVKWALHNEENWNRTHRFTGKVWMLCGAVILATVFMPTDISMGLFIVLVLLMIFLPMVYSYMYYRKQLKAGTAAKGDLVQSSSEKITGKLSFIVGAVVVAGVIIFLLTGKYSVNYGADSFTVDANYQGNTKINYADIESMEYRETDDAGGRDFGFATPFIMMGKYTNKEFGSYTRYTYTSCDSCVVIKTGKKTLVVNGKDVERTKEIYNNLQKKTGK